MIIDFHVHCFPDELASKAISALSERAGIPAWLDGTVKGIESSMESAGIDCSVVLSIATKPSQTEVINTWSGRIQNKGIHAFGSIHPDYREWKQELERIKEIGLKGIKLHPDYQDFFVDDERMLPIYEFAFGLGLIVVFHAGVDIGFKPPYHCTPDRLSKLIDLFPGGRIVAAHMGGYLCWDDVEKYLVGRDIYLDTSYILGCMGREQIRRIILDHGYKKVLFGSDSPWTEQAEGIDIFKALDLGCGIEKAILGENAAELLNL